LANMTTEFRDLRPDIRARLEANSLKTQAVDRECEQQIQATRRKYEALAKDLLDERDVLAAMLQAEKKRLGGTATVQPTEPLPPIGDFFLDTIKKQGPKSKAQLRQMAQDVGYFPNEESGGRATHITLENFLRSGRILRDEHGNLCLPEQVAENTQLRLR